MSNTRAILSAVDYIETHLHEPLAVGEVAQAVGYSLFYFSRSFNQATHHSPYDYLMRRRLSKSACALVEGGERIIDIAFDHGFSSPEVYARAFKRMFGFQPRQFRQAGRLDRRWLMPRLSPGHLEQRRQGCVQPTVETMEVTQVAGVAGLLAEDQTGAKRLWTILEDELDGLPEPERGWRRLGIRSYPKLPQGTACVFMAGVEAPRGLVEGTALVTKTLPASEYVRLELPDGEDKRQFALEYAYATWLPKADRRLAFPWQIEEYRSAKACGQGARVALIPVE